MMITSSELNCFLVFVFRLCVGPFRAFCPQAFGLSQQRFAETPLSPLSPPPSSLPLSPPPSSAAAAAADTISSVKQQVVSHGSKQRGV
jgi:hypothetical protein